MRTGRLVGLLLVFVLLFSAPAQAAGVSVVIKLDSLAKLQPVLSLLGGTLTDSIPGTNIVLAKVPSVPLLNFTLRLLGVQWVQPNDAITMPSASVVGALAVPAQIAPNWYRSQPALQLVRSAEAQAYSTGRGVVVADINSQVDYGHPALIGHLTSGYDFIQNSAAGSAALNQSSSGFLDQSSSGFLDQSSSGFLDQSSSGFLDQAGVGFLTQSSSGFLDGDKPAYGHGTLTVSLIAAVAPDAMIMPIRAFDENGSSDVFTLAKAVNYATTHGAQVINMSFGTLEDSKVLKDQIDLALASNVVLVASSGNNNTSSLQYPAAYAGVIGTAATDLFDVKGSFSNYGSTVYVDAPGVNLISAYPGNRYRVVSGTSFSAPIVAGAAALVRSLKSTGVTSALADSAVNIDARNPQYARKLGKGRIDVLKSVHP